MSKTKQIAKKHHSSNHAAGTEASTIGIVGMAQRQNCWPVASICVGLMAAMLSAYMPLLKDDFINLDDPDYVIRNAYVTTGVHWSNIVWAFRDVHLGTWHPLTWVSHMVDAQIYGLWAGGHHLTNLLLHSANTLLLFLLLNKQTRALWRSALVAALFALHPMHVESVAWVSERKDVLSAFFGLLSIWAYGKYAEREKGEGRREKEDLLRVKLIPGSSLQRYALYALALLFFALGLMSKPMLVTLPFLLLLLDYWPLRRVTSEEWRVEISGRAPGSALHATKAIRLVLEKVPFLVLSLADGLITLWGQKTAGAMKTAIELPLIDRAGNAAISYVRYLWKAIWPSDLAVFYPFPKPWPIWLVVGAIALMVGASALAITQARRRPYLLVGWFWYVISIAPVIGLIQVGMQAWADRYTYIPLIGVFIMISWGACAVFSAPILTMGCLTTANPRLGSLPSDGRGRMAASLSAIGGSWKGRQAILTALGAAAIMLAWFGARAQVRHWQSSETLFRHVVTVTRGNALAYQLLAGALFERGDLEGAEMEFRTALKIRPDFHNARIGLATTLARGGKFEEASRHFRAALERQPEDAEGQLHFADTLSQQGKLEEAIAHYQKAVQLQPGLAQAQNNLGNALQRAGRVGEAIPHYEAALRAEPTLAETHNNLGIALATQGKTLEAVTHYEAALQARSNYAEAYYNLGNALVSQGGFDAAITNFLAALQCRPQYPRAENSLGCALAMLGRDGEAIDHFDAALRVNPEYVEARFNLGSALARDGQEEPAIEQFQEALRLQPASVVQLSEQAGADAATLNALACAYAASGQFTNAVHLMQSAITITERSGQTTLLETLRRRLAGYRAGRLQP